MEYHDMLNYTEFPSIESGNVHFTVDDLLNFATEDETMNDAFFDSLTGNSVSSDSASNVTAVDSCNSSASGSGNGQFNPTFADSQFSGNELCVPYDDLAELEWLSNFVGESFSNDHLHHQHHQSHRFIPATATATTETSSSSGTTTTNHSPPPPPPTFPIPGKARSKRPRATPCDWSSRLPVLSPSFSKPTKTTPSYKRQAVSTPGRKCLHCASETTPQWRTGPMGPKTLCNACGVRYKSGRLVPEYRPAASPTFVSTKHSNSHRKVVELRRQKELQVQRQLMGQTPVFDASNGCGDFVGRDRDVVNCHDFGHVV